jgi:hypothetical protein
MSISKRSSTLLTGIIAGLIGGLVEFGWVTLYADITGADPHQFAPGIVSATGVRALLPGRPPSLLSIPVNLSFAVVLGIPARCRRPALRSAGRSPSCERWSHRPRLGGRGPALTLLFDKFSAEGRPASGTGLRPRSGRRSHDVVVRFPKQNGSRPGSDFLHMFSPGCAGLTPATLRRGGRR